MRHPELLELPHISSWIKEYEYTKEYKVPVPFEDRHPCWLDLREEYDLITAEMELQWHKQRQ